ncbi:MAG: outer membrane lipoprotein chaperone LolA [Gammaproteobacteria bacterium]|nr:outer membrane lipoprotein chaperone LolA [Gammaproteobacteria bacterium]MCP4090626.1 outer membrane lipoprotein chaperone LolA [Gammaproteobacteria bacterium]MCP4275957.1 outer membrane lipoprotein chaperone LolA [Gammaproteobacteria bacterium]MCP4832173.1 outer membrane lipoprotein chaperone LolA [Gammaproteobacteria bacterium]MCP4928226.1 outer membrane lipoprotein chaperone LolA [Gammaproteobacteria bacterium]
MPLHILKLVTALLLYGLLGSALANQAETDEARQRIQSFLDSANRYHAAFTQQLVDASGDVLEESSGEFWLQRPGQFRWHYAPPMERLLVSNGEKIWLYDIELEQVSVRAADGALEQTPAGLLVASSMALDDYQLSIRERSGELLNVGLKPLNGQSDFEDIVLGLEGSTLVSLTLADHFGQNTIIIFNDIEINPIIDISIFNLTFPPHVDIIDQTSGK